MRWRQRNLPNYIWEIFLFRNRLVNSNFPFNHKPPESTMLCWKFYHFFSSSMKQKSWSIFKWAGSFLAAVVNTVFPSLWISKMTRFKVSSYKLNSISIQIHRSFFSKAFNISILSSDNSQLRFVVKRINAL